MSGKEAVLGVDVGGTYIRLGIVDNEYKMHNFSRYPSHEYLGEGKEIHKFVELLQDYSVSRINNSKITAISIGFPSTIDKYGRILSTPNIRGFNCINIIEFISSSIDIPVYINKDVNLLLLHDIKQEKLEKSDCVIGCYFGTGIGNAIYINGKIYTGKNGVAGELGHTPHIGDNRKCTCGGKGCLEFYASGKYLEELTNKYFKGTAIRNVFEVHQTNPLLMEFIDNIAVTVAIEATIFDPDHIIIGGGVINMVNFPKDLLIEKIKKNTRQPLPSNELKIIFAENSQENGVIGAAIYAYNKNLIQ